ncbi:MAG: hypothetical protein ACQGVK_10720 [Myxococcota bacterium]
MAERARDPDSFLVARTWRVVPLLERREMTAADVEIEAVARLGSAMGDDAHLRCADLLRLVRLLFATPARRDRTMARLLRWTADALDARWPAAANPSAASLLSEVCAALGDPAVAEIVQPVASHWTGSERSLPGADAWERARALGVLALCGGRRLEIEPAIDALLRHAAEAAEPEILPFTQHGCAALLQGTDPERSRSLVQAATRGYAALDMHEERRRAEVLSVRLGESPIPTPPVARRRRMLQEGEIWTVEFDGSTIRLRDSKGLRDIHHLLQRPGWTVTALELMNAQSGAATVRPARSLELRSLSDEGLSLWRPCSSEGPDPRALREYAETARELRLELDAASQDADLGRVERARTALELIEQELGHTRDFRLRDARSPWERARKAVTKRIRGEIRTIASHHPRLGSHLEKSIRTGSVCSYSPHDAIDWCFDGPAVRDLATDEVARLPAM